MAEVAILTLPELMQVSVITGQFPERCTPSNRCPASTLVTYSAQRARGSLARSSRYTASMTAASPCSRLLRTILVLTAAICLACSNGATWAQSVTAPLLAAGLVKRATGTVSVSRAGVSQAVLPGLVVQVGDTFRTGPDGAVALALADDTLLSVGPDSELQVTAFTFDSTTQDGNLLASVWRGTVALVTGLIAKKAPENVRVQTRTVVLGVRGTEFIVDAGRGAP